jgi:hypothetical protein
MPTHILTEGDGILTTQDGDHLVTESSITSITVLAGYQATAGTCVRDVYSQAKTRNAIEAVRVTGI